MAKWCPRDLRTPSQRVLAENEAMIACNSVGVSLVEFSPVVIDRSTWIQHVVNLATRSRAPDEPPRNQHRAG
jgi:hypothetical protein